MTPASFGEEFALLANLTVTFSLNDRRSNSKILRGQHCTENVRILRKTHQARLTPSAVAVLPPAFFQGDCTQASGHISLFPSPVNILPSMLSQVAV